MTRTHRDVAEQQQGLVQGGLQLLLAAGLAACPQFAVQELGNELCRLVRSLHAQTLASAMCQQHMGMPLQVSKGSQAQMRHS